MNEARIANFALIGLFIIMLFTYVFAIQYIGNITGIETNTSVSVFLG